jgi:ATP-binding cassette subfamily B protein
VAVLHRQLPYVPRALGIVWAAARGWTTAWLVLLVVQGSLPIAIVLLVRRFVDGLVAAVDGNGGWEMIRGPLVLAISIAALMLLTELLRVGARWVRTAQSELVQDHISQLIQKRASSVDLALYDSPAYHDQLHRARADAAHRPVALLENMGSLLQNGITLTAMALVLLRFGWWVPLALFASTLPALWVVLGYAVHRHRWRMRTTHDQRRTWYYDWVLTSRESAQEVRLFDLSGAFVAAFESLRSRLRGESLQLARSQAAAEVIAAAFGMVVMGAAVAWTVVRTIRGAATIGELAMFAQAFSQGQLLLRTLLGTVAQTYSNVLFLENLFEFLSIEPAISDPEAPRAAPGHRAAGVAFRNVSFRYPGTDRPVLDDFELEVSPGTVVAILGANGAGKSTLFKLLCRSYDPDEGTVELDGIDIRLLRLADLRRRITVLFEEPVQYSESARRNVQLGDLTIGGDEDEVERAVAAAGADQLVAGLDEGLDTLLGTWFEGGTELSAGQWRRLALARSAIRDAALILLDEPTSSMDSWAEARWLRVFREMAAGRTAVLITHRLSTARGADSIHVIDDGRVVESGTHHELLAIGGRYAKAWHAHGSDAD